jgi:hypothetical protein
MSEVSKGQPSEISSEISKSKDIYDDGFFTLLLGALCVPSTGAQSLPGYVGGTCFEGDIRPAV